MSIILLISLLFIALVLWLLRPTGLFLGIYWQGYIIENAIRALYELDEWFMLITGTPKFAFVQMMQKKLFAPLKRPLKVNGLEIMDHFLTDQKIQVRLYRNSKGREALSGGLVFMHGGGWAIGCVGAYDRTCRTLARKTGFTVFSIEYSLSPGAKFPVAHNECYDVFHHISRNANDFGIDPTKIFVSGESAGGNLAASIALKARDDPHGGPKIRGQFLIYPVLDSNFFTDSYNMYARRGSLTRSHMVDFFSLYTTTPADLTNPYVAPLRAASLKGLPAAFIIAAEHDPLRDEALEYAQKLEMEGVPTRCVRVERGFHGVMSMAAPGPIHIEDAGKLLDEAAVWMHAL